MDVVVYSVLIANTSTSCLTKTKARLTAAILPWIRDNALQKLTEDMNLAITNDFIEGATTDVTIGLIKDIVAA